MLRPSSDDCGYQTVQATRGSASRGSALPCGCAAPEIRGEGTGGFLIVWHDEFTQRREAFVSLIPPRYTNFGNQEIGRLPQLELLQVFVCSVFQTVTVQRTWWVVLSGIRNILLQHVSHSFPSRYGLYHFLRPTGCGVLLIECFGRSALGEILLE